MKAFARIWLAAILRAIAFVMDSLFSIIGFSAVSYGAYLIAKPAGWIVGGLLISLIAEFPNGFNNSGRSR